MDWYPTLNLLEVWIDPKPPRIEGAPYLARSLRQMWGTADLSTALHFGRRAA
jgi:hypothetical protein